MVVVKPLYSITEAGTYWWATYSKHYKDKLLMTTSTYNPCLLVSTNKSKFGLVGMQTDDTLFLLSASFAVHEQNKLSIAGFMAKEKEKLSINKPLIFNGCILLLNAECNELQVRQKD